MAGDWIQMRHDLADDPAVIVISEAVGIEEDMVVGKLHRLWSWADRQTIDGNARGVTPAFVDRYLGVTGFAQAMADAGWLKIHSNTIVFPKFDEYISETAKQRALTARRARKHRQKRNAECVTVSVTKSAPKEEKRRDLKKDTTYPKKCVPPSVEEVAVYCETRANGIDPQAFCDYYATRAWKLKGGAAMKDWRAAVRTWEHRRKEDANGNAKHTRGDVRPSGRVHEREWGPDGLSEPSARDG